MPYRASADVPLMAALGVVGSDTDHFECPRCGAHDRERHLFLYLKASGLLDLLPSQHVLHFAPERHLSPRIAALSPQRYVKCDLYPGASDIERVDIESMPFSDCSFDMVIANHVLEHVADDLRALREIYRVLRPGGRAILQTPYSAILESMWCDPGITDDQTRLHAYGQEDHVRLFGRDIFERFAGVGLSPCIATHAELLADYDPDLHGVNLREPFFLFVRKA